VAGGASDELFDASGHGKQLRDIDYGTLLAFRAVVQNLSESGALCANIN
jgi:hypothetical protein